jgi:hypothetical protein
MKHGKLLAVLLIVAGSIPSYYRNRDAVDRKVAFAWGEMKAYWSSESVETRNLKKALSSNPVNMGKSGKSAGELHDEVIKKSEQRIDEREAKDVAPESGQK